MPLIKDIKKDIKNDIREAKKTRIPWWGVLLWIATCVLIEWLLIIDLGRPDLALPTVSSIAVVGFTIALKRKLARRVWFWITMAVLASLHVPLVLFVPWTNKWVPAIAIAAIASADVIAMVAILAVVGQFVDRPKGLRHELSRRGVN